MCLEKPLGLNLNRIQQWGLAGFQPWHLVVLTVDITDMKNEFQSSNRSATKTDDGPHLCGKHFCRPTLSPTLELWISWTSHGVPAMAIPCFGINQSRTARFGIPRYQNFNQIPNLVICRMYKISMYIYIYTSYESYMYILVHRFNRIWLSQVLMLKWLSTSGRRYIESRRPLHWCKNLVSFGCLLGCLWVINGWMLIQMFQADFKMHFCNAVKKFAKIQCTSNQCSALCGGHLWSLMFVLKASVVSLCFFYYDGIMHPLAWDHH